MLVASVTSAQQGAPSLDAILASFRGVEGMELRFREEKRIALLSVPAISEGTVHYMRPGRLARRTTSPSPQVVLIDGDELRMSEGGRVERIDLAAQPVVRSFVDTFSELLRGDRAALERVYRVQFTPREGANWTLTLAPRASPLDRFLREIRFEGEGTSLRTMVMTEVSGDVTTTTFSDVNTRRRYTAAEAARVFSLQ
ncbi:Putative transmembrane protein [Sandaracinus amylolyticus]|uniref:Putative transmembrane protein n=2 Tax=Sandaracinus amylolyticus TaxID=927083 RepID=A0A0F6WA62_9BACT|nr:Putative transmembrane protein [Sandaracinus amylolyticus]